MVNLLALQADTAQTPHAVHVLSRHLCAVKANKVEEDIQGATKVGKHVKWQVLDIKFGKQPKKESNGEVFDVSFLSSFFGAHSFPVT